MGRTASFLVNPRACCKTKLITDDDMIPETNRLNISVIGSGQAGLAFTTTSARAGHHVTLYKRADEIGEQFNMMRCILEKEEFNEAI